MFSKLSGCLTFVFLAFQLNIFAQSFDIPAPAGSGSFGTNITVLTNGNIVVADPGYTEAGKSNMGAVYLYNGKTQQLISTLKGSVANDKIGSGYIQALPNGHFLVLSPNRYNGAAAAAGAITWVNGITGLSGTVSSSNSLLGTKANDAVGISPVKILSNGNYVVSTPTWDNGTATDAGAVTWCNAATGVSGYISAANSLVGNKTNDRIGFRLTELTNGNFVTSSMYWGNGTATNAGAVTWVSGTTGLTGIVSASNSLVGSKKDDEVYLSYILKNGNYVVCSPKWDNGTIVDAGAATWGNGSTGVVGAINSSNSLVGLKTNDKVGNKITALINGNYVITSSFWDAGSIVDAGAVTWGNGTTGIAGYISSTNSLIGSKNNDKLGADFAALALSNGHYLVQSPNWDSGNIADAGAATWGDGNAGVNGEINSSNSLVGSTAFNKVGLKLQNLGDGKYAVISEEWSMESLSFVGAVTWSLGTTGIVGFVSAANSLVGATAGDKVGSGGVVVLTSGNYVVLSKSWINGGQYVGAATFINTNNPLTGPVTLSNSMVGTTSEDFFLIRVYALTNGNYVIGLPQWDNGTEVNAGAVFWGDGNVGVTGVISSSTALIGIKEGDQVGNTISPLKNGNYVVASTVWDNGAIVNAGFVRWVDGSTTINGYVNSGNSLVGSKANDQVGSPMMLRNNNVLVRSNNWDNGNIIDAGAITWMDGTKGLTGELNSSNSLVGTKANDKIGNAYFEVLPNGLYLMPSPLWDNGAITDAGAITWGNESIGLTGAINSCNSVLGTKTAVAASINAAYNLLYDYAVVGLPASNQVIIYNPLLITIANSLDMAEVTVSGTTTIPLITSGNCRLIAALKPAETANAVAGIVNAKVWVEATVPTLNDKPMVARHWEITPSENGSSATGKVTLYLLQKEFNDFNAHANATLKLPSSPSDVTGIANLKINKFSGTSSDGSGMPASYSAGNEIIDPADEDIVWNEKSLRWEISFEVTGFSGFIIQPSESVLPLRVLEFKGSLQNADALLLWKTEQEINTHEFTIERSLDGRIFTEAGKVGSTNLAGINNYHFTDKNVTSLNTNVIYYRLKQTDVDGKFIYAEIITLSLKPDNTLLLYPNPAKDVVKISVTAKKASYADIKIYDNAGKLIKKEKVNLASGANTLSFNISHLPKGSYVFELSNAFMVKRKQLLKL